MSRLRDWADQLGWYFGVGCVLIFFALLATLLPLVSRQDKVQWLGGRVTGSESDGLVTYVWDDEGYSFDTGGNATKSEVTVRVDRSDPNYAALDSTGIRITDAVMVLTPLTLAFGSIGLGARRRRRERLGREAAAKLPKEEAFGTGLDADFVRRQLEERYRPPS